GICRFRRPRAPYGGRSASAHRLAAPGNLISSYTGISPSSLWLASRQAPTLSSHERDGNHPLMVPDDGKPHFGGRVLGRPRPRGPSRCPLDVSFQGVATLVPVAVVIRSTAMNVIRPPGGARSQ